MALAKGEVIPNPSGNTPYKVVFSHGKSIISEHEVGSQSDGERMIKEILPKLQQFARRDNDI